MDAPLDQEDDCSCLEAWQPAGSGRSWAPRATCTEPGLHQRGFPEQGQAHRHKPRQRSLSSFTTCLLTAAGTCALVPPYVPRPHSTAHVCIPTHKHRPLHSELLNTQPIHGTVAPCSGGGSRRWEQMTPGCYCAYVSGLGQLGAQVGWPGCRSAGSPMHTHTLRHMHLGPD